MIPSRTRRRAGLQGMQALHFSAAGTFTNPGDDLRADRSTDRDFLDELLSLLHPGEFAVAVRATIQRNLDHFVHLFRTRPMRARVPFAPARRFLVLFRLFQLVATAKAG